jgi:hypothetical protein
MKLGGCMLLGLALLVAAGAHSKPAPGHLQAARFFYEPENSAMLRAVREGMEKGITFNGHYSRSYVSCGLACGTYFFVDRWTGGVVIAPEGSPPSEMTWDIAANRKSNVIKVTFGPMDGMGPGCSQQHFRLSRHKFIPTDKRTAIRCPK